MQSRNYVVEISLVCSATADADPGGEQECESEMCDMATMIESLVSVALLHMFTSIEVRDVRMARISRVDDRGASCIDA